MDGQRGMHTPESASPSGRVRLCQGLLKVLLFLWGAIIVTTGVGTLANYLNDPIEPSESLQSVFAHLVIGRLLLSYPVPIAIVGALLLLMTWLSWLGSREPYAPSSSSHQITTQDRTRLLKRLNVRYTQLRKESLQGAVEIELGLASRPAALANATSLAYRFPSQSDQLLPPQTTIVDVYEQAKEELLILGEPGAGKSTMLLQLASHLLIQSEQDEGQPIPILIPLSTWGIKRPLLQDWLIDQFIRLYDIPKGLSAQWIEAGVILPLLDGLDEMDENARPACITAINAYHRDHFHPLVVCSRTEEYNHATTAEQIALHAAVVVQPLSLTQVEEHLATLGKPLAALRSALKKNAALATLATAPLMLQILMLIYQGTTIRQLSQKKEELEQQIWATYVQQMIARKGKRKKERKGKHKREVPYYSDGQTVSWLRWLARSMRDHNQTIFSLEDLQPDVHPSSWVTASISYQERDELLTLEHEDNLQSHSKYAELSGGLKPWLPSTHLLSYSLSVGLVVGLLFGVLFGVFLGLLFGVLFGLVVGLVGWLLVWLHFSQFKVPAGRLLVITPFGGAFIGLIIGLIIGLDRGLTLGLFGGLLGGLLGGIQEEIRTVERIDVQWERLLFSLAVGLAGGGDVGAALRATLRADRRARRRANIRTSGTHSQ